MNFLAHRFSLIVDDKYLDYFAAIMEDRLWQTLAKPVSYGKTIRLINESGNFYKRRCPMPQKRIKANTFYNKDNSYFCKSVYPEEFPETRTPAAVPPRIVRKRMYSKLRDAEEKMAVQALHEGANRNKRTVYYGEDVPLFRGNGILTVDNLTGYRYDSKSVQLYQYAAAGYTKREIDKILHCRRNTVP